MHIATASDIGHMDATGHIISAADIGTPILGTGVGGVGISSGFGGYGGGRRAAGYPPIVPPPITHSANGITTVRGS